MRRLPRLCALALLTGLWSQQAWATPITGPRPTRAGSPKEVAELAERAGGASDPLSAIDTLAALQGAEATRALAGLLESGLPDASTDRILERLAEKPRPELRDALEAVARHRRPGARVLALRAIAAAGVADEKLALSASKLLAAALSDSIATVRGTAASALGQRFERLDRDAAKTKAKPAPAYEAVVDALLQAVAHGVPEAARAAGLAVPEAALPRLHEALRGLPLTATLDAYDAALARHTLSEAAKLDVLAKLGEIATPATKTFLQTLIAKGRFPLGSRLQRALVETEKQIVRPPAAAAGGKP